jgi:Glycosyltransferase family 87
VSLGRVRLASGVTEGLRVARGGGQARFFAVATPSRAARVPVQVDPHLALAAGAAAALVCEAAHRAQGSTAWVVAGAVGSAAGLLWAWRGQDLLRLGPVLAITSALLLAYVAVHLALDVTGDKDSDVVFRWQGNGLLRGEYPRSEYPVGAVALFALEAWVGAGSTRWSNAILMLPFQLATVTALWLTRTAYAPWLAALVGLWPLNAFYWQYKFDLVPAALLAVGLLLAWRERWAPAGVALGVGALVKWTPGLAAVVLVAWLVASRRVRDAVAHGATFVLTVAAVYLPFLAWSPDEVLAAYSRQAGRAITPESVWYLLLRPFDLAHVRTHLSFSAGAPGWADASATALQVLAVLAAAAAAGLSRRRLRAAVALAGLAPAAFLLTNRIFSPQFVLVLFVAWGFAAALLARTRREQLAVGVAMAAAAAGNAFVYPFALPWYDITWPLCSALLFIAGLTLTAWLALRAVRMSA